MPGPLPELLGKLRAEDWATSAVAELDAAGHASLAAQLRAALGATASAEACIAVVDALWRRAEEGVGWTEPFWRESYVLSCTATAVALCCDAARDADAVSALRHLDLAFIMGGPPDVLQPFVDVVEALVLRDGDTVSIDDGALLPRSLPHAQQPQLQPGLEICRLGADGWDRFRKEFYNVDAPCVLADLAGDWPALDKWRDLRWWCTQFGHRCVPLEVGSHTDGSWHESVVLMRDFVATLRAGDRVVYLAQHPLFEQLPALRDDFTVPACVGRRLTRINAWLGSRGTRTPLHYDSYDGLLTQAVGYKYVRLYPASNTPYLYRSTAPWVAQRRWPSAETEADTPAEAAPQGTISLVDVEQPDLQRFPLFEKACYLETVLGPGDALFIPAGCWHFVKSLSVSCSISFVF